jgi:hypothetical protein
MGNKTRFGAQEVVNCESASDELLKDDVSPLLTDGLLESIHYKYYLLFIIIIYYLLLLFSKRHYSSFVPFYIFSFTTILD